MKAKLLQTTQELVAIPSTEDRPEELQRAVDFCIAFCEQVPDLIVRQYQSGTKPSAVISTQDTLEPDVMFVGHLDVVSAHDHSFTPELDGEILRGRGVCDMKGPIAAMLHAFVDSISANPECNIALMLTTDEEVGGFDGVKYLVDTVGYRANVVIVPDGGDHPARVVNRNKASWILRVVAQGVSGHGSRPWLGENAIERLMQAFQKIRQLFPDVMSPDQWTNTVTISQVGGGGSVNQIPDEAWAVLDVRLTENTDATQFLLQMKAAAAPCSIEILEEGQLGFTKETNEYLALYAEIAQERLKCDVEFTTSCGANDGRYFSAVGVPVICSRPISGDQHSEHEWVNMDSLVDLYEIYVRFVEEGIPKE